MKEKIVCVEWEDASYSTGFYDKDKPTRFTPIKTRTVGHLIKSDKVAVVLSAERFYDNIGNIDDDRHIHTIPRKMIRRVIELKGG